MVNLHKKRTKMGKLYLLPNMLGDGPVENVLPAGVMERIKGIRVFATENAKNTRRFLKRLDREIAIDGLTFLDLNEHSNEREVEAILSYLEKEDVGVISEAGCPGIADPGAELAALAHRRGAEVVPLVGPSSILLALMASGCTGQRFSFNGYLPVNRAERTRTLRAFERQSAAEDRTQIFIETPYRNTQLFEEMTATLQSTTRLTIARDITTPEEWIRTKTIKEWRNEKPDLHKRPAIFVLHA